MVIHGPAGSGKTKTALLIASGLGGRIAVVDTENGSASRYAGEEGVPDFDVDEVRPPYSPQLIRKKIWEAHEAGYATVILDSLTAFWKGQGGVLQLVDEVADRAASRGYKRDTFGAWKEVDPIFQDMILAIQGSPINVIATLRAKMSYEKDETTKKIQKLGYAPEFREGAEYEFDLEASMTMEHLLVIGKTRITPLDGKMFKMPGRSLGEGLARWLDGEEKPAAAPPKVEAPPPATPSPKPESERRPAPVTDAPADELLVEIAAAADLPQLAAVAARIKSDLDRKPDNARRAKLELAYGAKKKTLQAKAAPTADPPADGDPADQWDRGAA